MMYQFEDYDDAKDEARLMSDDEPPTRRVNDKGWIYIKIMPDDDQDDSEPGICPACNGSGEGMHEGTTCRTCKGEGEC